MQLGLVAVGPGLGLGEVAGEDLGLLPSPAVAED